MPEPDDRERERRRRHDENNGAESGGYDPAHDPEQDDAYPRPRVRLARNWVQPKRAFDFDKDYHRLPRFRPDYGREPRQYARPRSRS